MAKAKIAKKVTDLDGRSVRFDFVDHEPILVRLDDLPVDIQSALALHGLSAKLGDSYSDCGGNVTEAMQMFGGVLDRLIAGDWRAAGVAGERRPLEVVQALFRFMERSGDKKTQEECEAVVDALRDADSIAKDAGEKPAGIKDLRAQLNEIIQEIRLENAKAKTDSKPVADIGSMFD